VAALTLLVHAVSVQLKAGVALLVGEPYGRFGSFNPTGHAAVYLSRICAESPTELRRCRPGEMGTVISRYRDIGGYDWAAVPLLPYLYAVTSAGRLPETPEQAVILRLRDTYRRQHLQQIAPDTGDGSLPRGNWEQLVGAAYDRGLHFFFLETSADDDDRLIEHLNSRANRRRFNILYRNCADFARSVINFYYPGAIRRSYIADAGITTPKLAAKSLVRYGKKHPELRFSHIVIPQVPGNPSSRRTRGVTESLVRTKKYIAPLAYFQPWVAAGVAAAYVTSGRFNPAKLPHSVCGPDSLADCLPAVDSAANRGG
jgi:hypothetical protein